MAGLFPRSAESPGACDDHQPVGWVSSAGVPLTGSAAALCERSERTLNPSAFVVVLYSAWRAPAPRANGSFLTLRTSPPAAAAAACTGRSTAIPVSFAMKHAISVRFVMNHGRTRQLRERNKEKHWEISH
ncbi:MAG: hypothetical protein AB7G10_23850, partial [Reyranellaceae bacterium]